jgi:hypothetical protein
LRRLLIDGLGSGGLRERTALLVGEWMANGSGGADGEPEVDFFRLRKKDDDFLLSDTGGCAADMFVVGCASALFCTGSTTEVCERDRASG